LIAVHIRITEIAVPIKIEIALRAVAEARAVVYRVCHTVRVIV
jgi:hypothetical protein